MEVADDRKGEVTRSGDQSQQEGGWLWSESTRASNGGFQSNGSPVILMSQPCPVPAVTSRKKGAAVSMLGG